MQEFYSRLAADEARKEEQKAEEEAAKRAVAKKPAFKIAKDNKRVKQFLARQAWANKKKEWANKKKEPGSVKEYNFLHHENEDYNIVNIFSIEEARCCNYYDLKKDVDFRKGISDKDKDVTASVRRVVENGEIHLE